MNQELKDFIIQTRNLTYNLKNFSLENINLNLEKEKIHVILGSTGSGKTLLLEILAGLIPIKKNQLFINKHDAFNIPPEKREIAYLPQDIVLFPNKKVLENIIYPLFLKKIYKENVVYKELNLIVQKLNIDNLMNRKITCLSGGEKQRVALARVLISKSPIILLDEPTSSVNESLEEEIFMFLKEFHEMHKPTIVIATHNKDGAFFLGDYIHFIEKGKIIFSFIPREMLSKNIPKSIAKVLGIKNIFQMYILEKNKDYSFYYCPYLESKFCFSNKFCLEKREIFVGVRPHDIRVIKQEEIDSILHNKFQVIIEKIYFKEINAYVVMRHIVTNYKIFMELSIYTLKKLKIQEGESIFCKIKETYSVILE